MESETCNGTVTAMQMCYQSRYRNYGNREFSEFVLLRKTSSNRFIVTKTFPLNSHMTSNVCTSSHNAPTTSNINYICCENMTLDHSNQFNISSLDDFGFGIRNTDSWIKPLRFTGKRYDVPHYQKRFPSTVPTSFSISSLTKSTSESLIDLRFFMSKLRYFYTDYYLESL